MTMWDYIPQRHPIPPYWITSMNASVNKNDKTNLQRTPFGRFIHLTRLFASFLSLKCQNKGNVYFYVSFLHY